MNTISITPPNSLFIDPRTGTIAREWYLFLIGLTRTLESILAQFSVGTAQSYFIDSGSSGDGGEADFFLMPGPPGAAGSVGAQGPAVFSMTDNDPVEVPMLGTPSPSAQVVTGSRATGAALISLIAGLGALGLVIDQSTT